MSTLEEIVARADTLAQAPLAERLQWLEDAAAACERSEEDGGLGPRGARVVLLLRAALGVVVKFAQGPKDGDALVELELAHKTLMTQALFALTSELAALYDGLAQKGGVHRDACRQAAEAYRAVARAVERGEPVSEKVRDKMRALDASVRFAAHSPR